MPSRSRLVLEGCSGKPGASKDDYTTNKLGEIREKVDALPADFVPTDFCEEPVTMVLGKEKPGRVRGLGFGCSQKDVRNSGRYENEKIQQLQQEKDELQNKVNDLADENGTLKQIVGDLQVEMKSLAQMVKALVGRQ